MTDLIHRLEAAEGPSRELDALIWAKKDGRDVRWENNRALAKSRKAPFDECILGEYVEWAKGEASFDCAAHKPPIPAYTASLDAAVSLVENDGWGWEIDSLDPLEPSAIVGQSGICEAETPALALLVAFFKARAALKALEAENAK